jgi:hypothetical protein
MVANVNPATYTTKCHNLEYVFWMPFLENKFRKGKVEKRGRGAKCQEKTNSPGARARVAIFARRLEIFLDKVIASREEESSP